MGNQPKGMGKETPAIRWVKTAGTLRLRDGRVINAGQEFLAHPDDIPEAFRDTVRPVKPEELRSLSEPPLPPPLAPIYRVVPSLPGRFRVVDGQGKVVAGAEGPLSAKDAAEMVERLTAG